MEWFIKLGLVLFASFGNLLAQQGYNYDRPKQPFETSGTFPSSPGTARYPTGTGGFPSSTGLTQRPSPGSQRPSGYPETSSSTDGSTPGTRPTGAGVQDSIFKPSFPTGPQTGYQSSRLKPSTSTAQGTDATFPGAPIGSDYQSPGFKSSISTGQKPSTATGGYSGTPSTTGSNYQGTISIGQGTGAAFPGTSTGISSGIPSTTGSGYQQPAFKPSIATGQKTGVAFPGAATGTPTTGQGTGATLAGIPAGNYFGQTSASGDGYQKSGFNPTTTTAQGPGSTFPDTLPTPGYQASGFKPSIPTGQGSGGVFPGTTFGGNIQIPTGGFTNGQQQIEEEKDEGDYSAIPGEPGTDYPIYSEIPSTSFTCDAQQYPGYYADTETRCQVFHICANNKTYDFLCPNGTVFHQEYLVCVWWNQFDCSTAPSLYGINAYIYDYSINGVLQQMAGFSQSGVAGGSRSPITPSGYPDTTAQQDGGQFPTTSDGSRGYSQVPGSINQQDNNRYPGATGTQRTPQQGGGPTPKGPGSYSGANDKFPRGPAVTSPQQGGGQFPTAPGVSQRYPQVPSSITPPQGGVQILKGPSGYSDAPLPQEGGAKIFKGPGGYSGTLRPQEGDSPSVSTPYQFPSQPSGYPGTTQAISGGSVSKDTISGYQANQIGYPREQPSVPFPGTKPQPPNREYLPPINGK